MLQLLPQFSDRIDCRFLGKNDDRTIANPHVYLHQVHGNRTIISRIAMESTEQADGVITDQIGLHLTVRAADCQNFAIYDPVHHTGGVLHAGWRGMLCKAIPAFFDVLKHKFAIDAADCFVAAGPSLCLSCAQFDDANHELRKNIDPIYVHDGHVDLQKIAVDHMMESGVQQKNFTRHPDCTRCHPKKYLTYRGGDKPEIQSGVSNILVLTLL